MTGTNSSKVDIILVHGLFIGAWAWARVKDQLSPRFTVHTPELPFESLAGDAAMVRDIVSSSIEAGRAVLLVGHSYGGMVISEAGHDATGLCFVATLVPQPGQGAGEIAAAAVSQLCKDAMVPSSDGGTIELDPQKALDAWYHLCSREDAEFGIAQHRSAPSAIFAETVERPAWLERPSSYIICSEDRALDPEYQRTCGLRMGSTASVTSDHSPFFSATDQLSSIIAGLAEGLTP